MTPIHPFFSFIIPVFNRPQELEELLESLCLQVLTDFEVIVVEDGSTEQADEVCRRFENKLDLHYYRKENSGQGFSRNYGFEKASGEFFIILDSDVILPPGYLLAVKKGISDLQLDAFGGPDAAHDSFSPIQKAISYSMTSVFTTGGIRGSRKNLGGSFKPRSFNMGISRKVWQSLGGFVITRLGEDIEYSMRVQQAGFRTALIPEAFVYHKRRTDFVAFWKQTHFFGRARINIYSFDKQGLKAVHFFPALFVIFFAFTLLCIPFEWVLAFNIGASCVLVFTAAIFIDSLVKNRNLQVAFLSITASYVQLIGYGIGFITDFFKRIVFKIH